MLRFPNPGSHIDSFIKIYKELFDALSEAPFFTLDDISRTLVERNLATSSGFMGQEALTRSTREDRSRDPLYNQSKMYAELFRMLGWFQSLPDSSLKYRMTFLGAHAISAYNDIKPLFRESVLGIAFPNEALDNKGNYILRPFSTILRSMKCLDGIICRDEIIVGPLNLSDDRNPKLFMQMISEIKALRGNFGRLQKALATISKNRKISLNTMYNYTRFPLAVLTWCGWTTKERNSTAYKKSIVFHQLTSAGEKQLGEIETNLDLRSIDFKKLPQDQKIKLARFCFYSMMARSGFDLSPVTKELTDTAKNLFPSLFKKQLPKGFYFSPFQEFDSEINDQIFPEMKTQQDEGVTATPNNIPSTAPASHRANSNLYSDVVLEHSAGNISITQGDQDLHSNLISIYNKNKSIEASVAFYLDKLQAANKSEFYPLVSALFRLLGFNCEHSRAGVNYQRWDALIVHPEESIPIEIKSPGEEQNISVKAVRQALENKIILLSRKPFPTKQTTTSLVVGYYMPNDRSEVSYLIEDIYKSFKVKIGIIDFQTLLTLVYKALINKQYPNFKDVVNLYGFIKI